MVSVLKDVVNNLESQPNSDTAVMTLLQTIRNDLDVALSDNNLEQARLVVEYLTTGLRPLVNSVFGPSDKQTKTPVPVADVSAA